MGRRLAGLFIILLAVAACKGDGVTAPPRYPSVAGTYTFSATYAQFASNLANASGTVTFTQPSRDQAAFSGVANVTVLIAGSTSSISQVRNATVNEAGAVSFELVPANTASTWLFTGSLSGTTMSGNHLLTSVGSSSVFSGQFTMLKQ